MPVVELKERSLIAVEGPDAANLLQNTVTTDIDKLAGGTVVPGALLTAQGKILFDFLISRQGESRFLLDCPAPVATGFIQRLQLYRLRAKAEIFKQDQEIVTVSWSDESSGLQNESTSADRCTGSAFCDIRFPVALNVIRSYVQVKPEKTGDPAIWHALRIHHGVAESGCDFRLGEVFPHDVLLDQNGGLSFVKGCFIGQEVVSRMQHRGTARKRMLVVQGDADLPDTDTPIMAAGRPVGVLGSTAGRSGLALVRVDRVNTAILADTPITAGNCRLHFRAPEWSNVTVETGPDSQEPA